MDAVIAKRLLRIFVFGRRVLDEIRVPSFRGLRRFLIRFHLVQGIILYKVKC